MNDLILGEVEQDYLDQEFDTLETELGPQAAEELLIIEKQFKRKLKEDDYGETDLF